MRVRVLPRMLFFAGCRGWPRRLHVRVLPRMLLCEMARVAQAVAGSSPATDAFFTGCRGRLRRLQARVLPRMPFLRDVEGGSGGCRFESCHRCFFLRDVESGSGGCRFESCHGCFFLFAGCRGWLRRLQVRVLPRVFFCSMSRVAQSIAGSSPATDAFFLRDVGDGSGGCRLESRHRYFRATLK